MSRVLFWLFIGLPCTLLLTFILAGGASLLVLAIYRLGVEMGWLYAGLLLWFATGAVLGIFWCLAQEEDHRHG